MAFDDIYLYAHALQGMSTDGGCRYRQAIPLSGRLDVDTNSGVRKGFLPRGSRAYRPLRQPTAQRVMADALSAGPTSVLLLGTHTNLALLLMSRPRLRRNVERVYVSGGAVRAAGNLFTAAAANPVAEFNVFGDPFAAYLVLHSGVPITMIPLDATNTIPVTEAFYSEFQRRQRTYEAQYCLLSLDGALARQRRRSDSHDNTASLVPLLLPCLLLHIALQDVEIFLSPPGACRASTCGIPSPSGWPSPACAMAKPATTLPSLST